MDRREMKKWILYHALSHQLTEATNVDVGERYNLAVYILDKDESEVTEAEWDRYLKLLRKMVENAKSKLK